MNQIKILLITLCLALAAAAGADAASLQWVGARVTPVAVSPDNTSGLNQVYVVESVEGLSAVFSADDAAGKLTWSRYSQAGGAYAEPVETVREGNSWTLTAVEPDMGYMIDYGDGKRFYFWVADWSKTPFELRGADVAESDCATTSLRIDGSGARMTYYSINGRPIEIDRQIRIEYSTMVYDTESHSYLTTTEQVTRPWLPELLSVPAPLCSTRFTIEGDRFSQAWGRGESWESTATFQPVAIDAQVEATVAEREVDNEQKVESGEIGGSAPVEVSFAAAVTEAAIFTQWQIATDPDFVLVDFTTNDTEMDYTFRESGNFYVRFQAANADATCEYESDVFTVMIGESALLIPNAFSPGASEGVNDIWKVSYKSIIDFECHIFNKWGEELFKFTDPAQGWDGRHKGKLVPAGVYYYVIKATGADGRKYDKAGDINIVNYR